MPSPLNDVSTSALLAELERRQAAKNASAEQDWANTLDNASRCQVIERAQRECGKYFRNPGQIALACDYNAVSPSQEIHCAGAFWNGHPRRPVWMRSSFAASGQDRRLRWAEAVAQRYIRAMKFTAFDRHEQYDLARDIGWRLRRKFGFHWRTEESLVNRILDDCGLDRALLNGKVLRLSDAEIANVHRLYKIVSKTDSLLDRMESVRETSRLRIAA